MFRNQDRSIEDERLTEEDSNVNSSGEIPRKPFRVTVECPMFLVMVASMFIGSALSNIILYRTCTHALNHSEDECKGFLSPIKTNDSQALEQEVQKYATFVSTVKSVLESVGPAILSLFFGAWSNTYGRRPILMLSLFGMTLTTMLTVIYSMMPRLGPWWYIVTCLPMALSGGYVALFTVSYCYISDLTSSDQTTLRMTLVDATVSAGMVVGSLLAKDLILTLGNVYLLLLGTTLFVLAFSYTSIFIPESVTDALEGGLRKLFDISLVKEMAHECLKERPNNGRAKILLLTLVRIISVFVLYGVSNLEYMYTRKKLHWALDEYNTYTAVAIAIGFVGGFFGLYVGQRLLNIGDICFAIFSLATAAAEFFIKSFAIASWQMYLGSTVSMFKGLSSSLIKSYLTKCLSVDDISKVFAMMCACEGIMPLISPVVFTAIYTTTIAIFPGAFLIFSGMLTIICVLLLVFVKCYSAVSEINYEPLNEPHQLMMELEGGYRNSVI